MRFTRDLPANVNLVRKYSADELVVSQQTFRRSCLMSATEIDPEWPPRAVNELTSHHFSKAIEWQPEIILLGTGVKQQFPDKEIYAGILAHGIGFEVMDTGAACRTYNVLVGENRRVVLGVLL